MTVPTATRRRQLTPGTFKTRFVKVRSVFKAAAVRDGMIAVDPTARVPAATAAQAASGQGDHDSRGRPQHPRGLRAPGSAPAWLVRLRRPAAREDRGLQGTSGAPRTGAPASVRGVSDRTKSRPTAVRTLGTRRPAEFWSFDTP